MVSVAELRGRLRNIRAKLAKNIGYLDFKYLHKMKRPELEALLKKYEKFETEVVGTIQKAIRNKKARNVAHNLIKDREVAQNMRDLELRLAFSEVPLISAVSDAGLSVSRKKAAIRDLYEPPLAPFSTFELFTPFNPVKPPTPKPTTPLFKFRTVEEGRVIPLSRSKVSQRPLSASSAQFRQRLQLPQRPLSALPRSNLSQLETKPRPESSLRTYNKLKLLV